MSVNKADRHLERILNPLDQGGGGWLDVQKALWECYTARKSQKSQWSFFRKPDRYIKWYEGLWRSDVEKIPASARDYMFTTYLYPELYQNVVENCPDHLLNPLLTKQQSCVQSLTFY